MSSNYLNFLLIFREAGIKKPAAFEMRRAYILTRKFLLFMLLRFGQGFLRAVRLIVQSETFRWPLFNALQERMSNQFFWQQFPFSA